MSSIMKRKRIINEPEPSKKTKTTNNNKDEEEEDEEQSTTTMKTEKHDVDFRSILSQLDQKIIQYNLGTIGNFTQYTDILFFFVDFLTKNRESIENIIEHFYFQPSQQQQLSSPQNSQQQSIINQLDNILQNVHKSINSFQVNGFDTGINSQPMDFEWFHHFTLFETIWRKHQGFSSEKERYQESMKDIFNIIEKCQDLMQKSSPTQESFTNMVKRMNSSTFSKQEFDSIQSDILQYNKLSKGWIDRLDYIVNSTPSSNECEIGQLAFVLTHFKTSILKMDEKCILMGEKLLLEQVPFIDKISSAFAHIGKIEDPTPMIELNESYKKLKSEIHNILYQCGRLLDLWISIGNIAFYDWFISNSPNDMKNSEAISETNIISLLKTCKKDPSNQITSLIQQCKDIALKASYNQKYITKYGKRDHIPNVMIFKNDLPWTSSAPAKWNNSDLESVNNDLFNLLTISKNKTVFMDIATGMGRGIAIDMQKVSLLSTTDRGLLKQEFIQYFSSMMENHFDNKIFQYFINSLFSIHPLLISSKHLFNNNVRPFIWIFTILDHQSIISENNGLEKQYSDALQFGQHYGFRDYIWNHKKVIPKDYVKSLIKRVFIRQNTCSDILMNPSYKKMYLGFDFNYSQLLQILITLPPSLRSIKFFGLDKVRLYFELDNAAMLMNDLLALDPSVMNGSQPKDNGNRLLDLIEFGQHCNIKNIKESRDIAVFLLGRDTSPNNNWISHLKPFIIVKSLSSSLISDDSILSPVEKSRTIQCGLNIYYSQYLGHYNRFLQMIISQLFCFNFEHPELNINMFSVFPSMEILGKTLTEIFTELNKSKSEDISLEKIQTLSNIKLSGILYCVSNIDQMFSRSRIGGTFLFKDPLNQSIYKQDLVIDCKELSLKEIGAQVTDFGKKHQNSKLFFIRKGKNDCIIFGFYSTTI